jgi:hypothetical protein
MSWTNTSAGDYLALVLNAVAIANIADNAASGPLTVMYISLHTSSPGASGNQTTNEAAYTSYTRISIARSSGSPAWTVTGNSASPNATIVFPTATGGSETETYLGVGTAGSGAGKLMWFGTLSPNVAVSNGVQPQLTTSTTVTGT